MDEQRAEFEAWAHKTHYNLGVGPNGLYQSGNTSSAWASWQAATQRQQERIAELQAQVQALGLDAGRWKTFISLPSAIRAEWACNLSLVPVLTQWIDQAAINAAVESRKEQS